MYLAHSKNAEDKAQPLSDHLRQVAQIAASFADVFGASDEAYLAGMLHDLGKASAEFQDYLARCNEAKQHGDLVPVSRTDHKLAGVRQALLFGEDAGVLGIPILGHHGGMPDNEVVEAKFKEAKEQSDLQQITERALALLPPFPCLRFRLPKHVQNNSLALDFLIRMLFSCLVDADFLDTERHFKGDKACVRSRAPSLSTLWVRFQNNQVNFQREAAETNVNKVREKLYVACLDAADRPQGVFRLTVPTGGGKTRSGMAFALKHAIRHGLRRIIIAIPYTSIIDQNARKYREIFWPTSVLEHHSALIIPDGEGYSEEKLRMELAAENWDAPIVVTTTVQLFDSLFSNETSKCRKLHNIANSVLIIDEVQTLPLHMLQPILDVLKELVAHYGVSLVLSTATQPALSGDSPYLSGFVNPVEIVHDPDRYFKALERVVYEVAAEPWSWEQVVVNIRAREKVLCVVNSRKDARELFTLLDDSEALHLSALMCPAHRKNVLEQIRARLAGDLPCRVVSTQVVEAGVDLDFPCVMRALGPLDRIVQAAGRCNREGKLLPDLGKMIVFIPAEGSAPRGNYRLEMQVASTSIAESSGDLNDSTVMERYFADVYQTARKKGLDAKEINKSRYAGNFEQTARAGKLIEDDTVPLLVRFKQKQTEIAELLSEIDRTRRVTRELWRKLQQYMVNVYRWEYDKYAREGLIREVIAGVGVWEGKYDDKTGLSDAMLDPADLIVQ